MRPILQLAPLTNVPVTATNLLSLAFSEGGVLEISWDAQKATLQIFDPAKVVVDSLVMSRTGLSGWLRGIEAIAVAPGNIFSFGYFDFSWEVGDNGPCLYTRSSPQVRTCAGTLDYWEDLRIFLGDANVAGLF